MADEQSKSLEMRIAAIEDKLSKLHITEDEMKAYEKVSSMMGAGAPAPAPQLSPQLCYITRQRVVSVYCWRTPTPITSVECNGCGPCGQSGAGGGFGGGFGGFGM